MKDERSTTWVVMEVSMWLSKKTAKLVFWSGRGLEPWNCTDTAMDYPPVVVGAGPTIGSPSPSGRRGVAAAGCI